MNKLMLSIANFPLPLWRKFIPSLPSEIKSFNTVQRFWFVVSVASFYPSIIEFTRATLWTLYKFFSPVWIYTKSAALDDLLYVLFIASFLFFPIVLYHAASLLSALFGFIFEKQLKK